MKAGAKHTYDPEKLPNILASIKVAKGSLGQVADLNEIARRTFYCWVVDGDEDNAQGLCTDLSQFSRKIRKEQAIVVTELARDAFGDEKKSRFIMWWLSKICREDFADDSEEMRVFKDLLMNQIVPMLSKGVNGNGSEAKKVDTESTG